VESCYSVVFSAIAPPLTYLPILFVANDSEYMGGKFNGRVTNVFGSAYLVVILAASLAAIPLMTARDKLPAKRHRRRLLDARLHLLHRQLIDERGDPVGMKHIPGGRHAAE